MRHKKQIPVLIISLLFFVPSRGQELYNLTLPASVPPKDVLGVRLFNESYNESGITRNISALKLMYGVTSKFSLTLSGVAADYHSLDLPVDFIKHDHSGKGPVASAAVPAAVSYPYIFAGTDLYGQYRFLSNDGQNTHFRMAAYGEASYIRIASHLAEPDLIEHNSGVGAGVIATYLRSHFAGTLTVGGILPFEYKGNSYDIYGGQYPVTFRYGNAVKYDLALGYLLFPRKYRNYDETNVNVYVEFLGKTYGAADVTQQDGVVTYHIPNSIGILEGGSYVEVSPGVQCIIKSDVRVEFSLGMPLINSSYLHEYPIYYVAMQKYFFFHRRRVSKND